MRSASNKIKIIGQTITFNNFSLSSISNKTASRVESYVNDVFREFSKHIITGYCLMEYKKNPEEEGTQCVINYSISNIFWDFHFNERCFDDMGNAELMCLFVTINTRI